MSNHLFYQSLHRGQMALLNRQLPANQVLIHTWSSSSKTVPDFNIRLMNLRYICGVYCNHNIIPRNKWSNYFNQHFRPFSNSSYTKKATAPNANQKIYKELDAEKLLRDIENQTGQPLTKGNDRSTGKNAINSEPAQRMPNLKTERQKKINKIKEWFNIVRTINVIIGGTIIFNVLYCWYYPVHRVKASNFNPYFGKLLDAILDPVDEETKRKAEADQVENPVIAVLMKEKIMSFKESIEGKTTEKADITDVTLNVESKSDGKS